MKTPLIQCLKLLCRHLRMGVENRPVYASLQCCRHYLISLQDNEGLSPLHWAVMCEQVDHIRYILRIPSVDASVQDSKGRSPLVYAVLNYSPACIKVYCRHYNMSSIMSFLYRLFLTAVRMLLIIETVRDEQHFILPVQKAQLIVYELCFHLKSNHYYQSIIMLSLLSPLKGATLTVWIIEQRQHYIGRLQLINLVYCSCY